MARSRANVRVFSDDGFCVSDALLMRRALEYVKAFDGVIAQHAQEPRLTQGAQMNEGALSGELGLTGWPAVAEESIIARDVLLAEHVGSRLHICHVSTAGSVDVIRWAKARGIQVTAEVTPHHLLLTEDLISGYDARFKVNPPLRRREDVEAVRAALADGTIDIVATDHAPHPSESKECEWDAAANGMVGLESALSVVHASVVENGLLDWNDVARVLSQTPARIGRIRGHGEAIAVGAAPEIVLYDPSASRAFGTADLAGRSVNSPYLGRTLPGRVVATFHHGYATVLDGDVLRHRRDRRSGSGGARMTDYTVPAIIVIAITALILLAMWLGWRGRSRRDVQVGAYPLPASVAAPIVGADGVLRRHHAAREAARAPEHPQPRLQGAGPGRPSAPTASRSRSRARRRPGSRARPSAAPVLPPSPSTGSSSATASSASPGPWPAPVTSPTATCASPTPPTASASSTRSPTSSAPLHADATEESEA